MTTITMREKIIIYLADADDSKIADVYTFLEKDIEADVPFKLTEEHYNILREEEAEYLRGEGKSYTREEAMQIAKGLRDFNV